MELKMYLAGNLIDSEPINDVHLNIPGYIGTLKYKLEEKHESILDSSESEPEFYLDAIPSSMNHYKLSSLRI